MPFTPLTPAPRAVLVDFAQALEATISRNDHKPDWVREPQQTLVDKLREEVAELEHELRVADEAPGSTPRVALEALDVALCALMLWDRARGAAASQNRGRA